MDAFISEPRHINPVLRLGLWWTERIIGQRFLPGRLVAQCPRAALAWTIGSALGPSHDRTVSDRILQLVAITSAYTTASPYCTAGNVEAQPISVSEEELAVLKSGGDVSQVPTFTARERLAIGYARLISATPLQFPSDFVAELKANFTEREIVVLAAAAAQINYNARLIESLGAPPPDFKAHPPHRYARRAAVRRRTESAVRQ